MRYAPGAPAGNWRNQEKAVKTERDDPTGNLAGLQQALEEYRRLVPDSDRR